MGGGGEVGGGADKQFKQNKRSCRKREEGPEK